MQEQRVAVTGLGVVCALGRDPSEVFDRLLANESGLAPVEAVRAAGFERCLAGLVEEGAIEAQLSAQERLLPRGVRLALVAARQALADGGRVELGEGGLWVNTIFGGPFLAGHPLEPLDDAALSGRCVAERSALASKLAALARGLDARAQVAGLVVTCAGNIAIGAALDAVRSGRVPFALAGGFEDLALPVYAGMHRIRTIGSRCRPFDQARDGLAMAEGAAFLLLEPLSAALAAGRPILAEMVAVGYSNDAHDLVAPEPQGRGAALAMGRALSAAGIEPRRVDYINAHGTGTQLNDATEARAIAHLFAAEGCAVAVGSTKGATGHAMGAASAIEAVATVMALQRQQLPATAGLTTVDPELAEIDLVSTGRDTPVRVALSNSFGFGGNNGVLVLARHDAAIEPAPEPARPVYIAGGEGMVGALAGLEQLRSLVSDPGPATAIGGPIDLAASGRLPPKGLRNADRATALLAATAAGALQDWPGDAERERCGIVVGNAHPAFGAALGVARRFLHGGPEAVHPGDVVQTAGNSAGSWLAIVRDLRGYAATTLTGACAGLDAIALGSEQVARGRVDSLVAGGLSPHYPALWQALEAAGADRVSEAGALVELVAEAEGAWAQLLGALSTFDVDSPAAALTRACAGVQGRGPSAPIDLAFLPATAVLATAPRRRLDLRTEVGDGLAGIGALAVLLGSDLIARGLVRRVLVGDCDRAGYATALLLVASE